MASTECFHFTKLKHLYSIRNIGLQPRLDKNSKAVGDTNPKVSFSDSKVGAIGLFLEFYRVYNDYKSGNRKPNPNKPGETEMYDEIMKSKSLEDYLGEGTYLLFDGTNIENEGGNTGKGGIFDASTSHPIESSKLKVGLIRNNETKHVSYSMYDYINYLMVNLTDDEISRMPPIMKSSMKSYMTEHYSEISKFRDGNFSKEEIDINTFCRVCKKDIDNSIAAEHDLDNESRYIL